MQVSSYVDVLFTVPVIIRQTLVWSLISKLIGGTPAGTAASSLGIEVRDRQHQAVLNSWQVWVPQLTQVPTPIKWSENCILVWLDMKMEFVIMKYRLHSCHFLKRCQKCASVDKVNICHERREEELWREKKVWCVWSMKDFIAPLFIAHVKKGYRSRPLSVSTAKYFWCRLHDNTAT